MTDRLNGVTVIFDRDIREDDAKKYLDAIRMIKGVKAVKPIITEGATAIAGWRARQEMIEKLHAFIETLSKEQL